MRYESYKWEGITMQRMYLLAFRIVSVICTVSRILPYKFEIFHLDSVLPDSVEIS